jgi:hypothetical protein
MNKEGKHSVFGRSNQQQVTEDDEEEGRTSLSDEAQNWKTLTSV